MNPQSCLLSLALIALSLSGGTGLKCYVSSCTNKTDAFGYTSTCHSQGEYICPFGYDRCMSFRTQVKQGPMTIDTDIQNCTISPLCSSICADTIKAGGTCKSGCCAGDLCNRADLAPDQLPTVAPTPSKGPSGEDLTCYSCSSANFNDSDANYAKAECTSPVKRKCGNGVIPGTKQNQCISIKLKKGDMEYEMRNCSDSFSCNPVLGCKEFQKTGGISECNIKCCYGNLCNDGQKPTSDPTSRSIILDGIAPCLLLMFVNVMKFFIG